MYRMVRGILKKIYLRKSLHLIYCLSYELFSLGGGTTGEGGNNYRGE